MSVLYLERQPGHLPNNKFKYMRYNYYLLLQFKNKNKLYEIDLYHKTEMNYFKSLRRSEC